jgi:thioesterase DpgC
MKKRWVRIWRHVTAALVDRPAMKDNSALGDRVSERATNSQLKAWLQTRPVLDGGTGESDAQALSRFVLDGEAILQSLPGKLNRTAEEQELASHVHAGGRLARRTFLSKHSVWLYRRLTNDFGLAKRLDELALEAVELCGGLGPSAAQLTEERRKLQAEKEGREIDLGILFHAFLASPETGRHLVASMLRPTERAVRLLPVFRAEGHLNLGSVRLERHGPAAKLTVCNAYCLNAEDDDLAEAMETAVDVALLDPDVRVGVLRGDVMTHPRYAGRRVFSAGINLKALHAGQISFVNFLLRREFSYINKIYRGLNMDGTARPGILEKPWIAAVDTFAIGGGAQLLLTFDYVIAASDSYLSLPAAQEGIVPGLANLRLVRALGSRRAREVLLFGRKINAREPDARLLVNEVVEPSEMDAAVERAIQQLSGEAVVANRHMLHLAEEPLDLFLQYASEFALVQAERIYSKDVLAKIHRATVRTKDKLPDPRTAIR